MSEKRIEITGRFKKDLKRFRNNPKRLSALKSVLELLRRGDPLPVSLCTHRLLGEYEGCLECHIGPDYLLIWSEPFTDVIVLLRLGSHAELFR